MSNIEDSLEAYLSSRSNVDTWKQEFTANWFKPIIKMMKTMALEGAREGPDIDQAKLMGRLSPEAQRVLRGE